MNLIDFYYKGNLWGHRRRGHRAPDLILQRSMETACLAACGADHPMATLSALSGARLRHRGARRRCRCDALTSRGGSLAGGCPFGP